MCARWLMIMNAILHICAQLLHARLLSESFSWIISSYPYTDLDIRGYF